MVRPVDSSTVNRGQDRQFTPGRPQHRHCRAIQYEVGAVRRLSVFQRAKNAIEIVLCAPAHRPAIHIARTGLIRG